MTPLIDITLPIRTYSANHSEHWRARHKRNKDNAKAIRLALAANSQAVQLLLNGIRCHELFYDATKLATPLTGLVIEVTRIAPRQLDAHDNLRMAMKGIIDTVADYLAPGLKPGMADALFFNYEYKQEKGKPKEYGIRIRIYQKEIAPQNET